MRRNPFNLVSDLAVTAGSALTGPAQTILGDDIFEVSPAIMRRLMLDHESSFQGRLLEIFGDDEPEQVDTMARLLEGSSREDLNRLAGVLQQAVVRLLQRTPDA